MSRCITMLIFFLLISMCIIVSEVNAFIVNHSRKVANYRLTLRLTAERTDAAGGKDVKYDKEYYKGFLSSPIVNDDNRKLPLRENNNKSSTRGDGIEQALKLGGGVSVLLLLLILAFLKSNNVF